MLWVFTRKKKTNGRCPHAGTVSGNLSPASNGEAFTWEEIFQFLIFLAYMTLNKNF